MPPTISCPGLEADWLSPGSSPIHARFNGPPSPLAACGMGSCDRITTSMRPRPLKARIDRALVADVEMAKSDIAQLQEFVQGSKQNPMPSNCSILQWSYDQRMVEASLEFQATVAFVLDGIPHHVLGTWQTSKKRAQRDVANRALCLFVTCWGHLAESDSTGMGMQNHGQPQPPPGDDIAAEAAENVEDAQILERFCCSPQSLLVAASASAPSWSHTWEGDVCHTFVKIDLLGVPHTFSGEAQSSLAESCKNTAMRALWYLQCPGFEDLFEPDLGAGNAKDIRDPGGHWIKASVEAAGEDKETTEKKTVLMRLQNRLQQNYARQIHVGQSAIYWSYERHASDIDGPPLVRATAKIPAAEKTFKGGWQITQREAQIDTSHCISQFLDLEFPAR